MAQSVLAFNNSISSIRPNITLTETEESWDKIARSITAFTELIRSSSVAFPQETIAAAREFYRPIIASMRSERTRLSGPAIDSIRAMAEELGTSFDSILPLFFPALLQLCARASKVVITRSRACIMSIIDNTQLVSVLSYFLQSIKDKSTTLRVVVAEGTLACINSCNPPDLEKESRTKEIEAIIKAAIRDANADVRKIGKQVFHAYETLLPGKVENFAAPLTPTSKKYLGLITRPKSALSATTAPPRPVNNDLSRSTSASVTTAPAKQPQLKKKVSQKLGPSLNTTASSTSSSIHATAPKQAKASSSTAGYQSRPTSRLGTVDTRSAPSAPVRGDTSQQPQSSGFVLVRPTLPISHSDSTTSTGKHLRSASTVTATTSGPVRNAKPLSRSTSSAPQRVPIVASSTTDASSAPDVRAGCAPMRVDPGAGRERVHTGPKKPELPKLSAEEPPIDVIRPPPNANKGESEVEKRRKERQGPKKPELPKLTGAGPSSRKEESTRKPEVPRLPRKETQSQQQVTALSKKTSMKTLRPATERPGTAKGDTDAGSNQANTGASVAVGVKTSNSTSASQTASSRARTISHSTSASSLTTTKPPLPRSRTISTPAAEAQPPAARARTISASSQAQAAKPTATRTRTISANSTTSTAATTSSTTNERPAWGRGGSGVNKAASVRRAGAKEKEPVSKIARPREKAPKEKRPSVVPEELEGVDVPVDIESAAEEQMEGEVEPTKEKETANDEGTESKDIVEQIDDRDTNSPALVPESSATTLVAPCEVAAASEKPNEEAPLIEFSTDMDTTESPTQENTRSAHERHETASALTHESDLTQSEDTITDAHVCSDKLEEAEDATPVAKVFVDPSTPSGPLETPVRKNPHEIGLDLMTPADGEKTPITALLSSIQKGFLFSPVNPLSPPDSYLPRGLGGTGTSVPFPLFSNKAGELAPNAENAGDVSDKVPIGFGIGWVEKSRQALGTMN